MKTAENFKLKRKQKSSMYHTYNNNCICDTDKVGFERPRNMSPLEIAIHAPLGFISLWAPNSTLRWRFQERSINEFADQEILKNQIRSLMQKAIQLWGYAVPIRFTEQDELYDFEIVVREGDRCYISGCVLASAFFPDPGRHELVIYPKLFEQPEKEQIETFAHELGHIFGLRHFFAKIDEKEWPSEIFGNHESHFTIMNYGEKSTMTDQDKNDLHKLYQGVWNKQIHNINGTPIKLVKPFSSICDSQ